MCHWYSTESSHSDSFWITTLCSSYNSLKTPAQVDTMTWCHYKKWLIPWHQQHLVNFSITASPSSCSSSVEHFVKVNISWSWTIHYFLSHVIYCQLLWNHGKHTMNSSKVLRSFKVTYWHLHFSTWLVSQLNPKGSMKELKVKEILVWSWSSRYWRIKSGRDDHQRWFHNNHACSVV